MANGCRVGTRLQVQPVDWQEGRFIFKIAIRVDIVVVVTCEKRAQNSMSVSDDVAPGLRMVSGERALGR